MAGSSSTDGADVVVRAQRAAGRDDHALPAQRLGERVAGQPRRPDPDEVRLRAVHLGAQLAQPLCGASALAADRAPAPLDLAVAGAQGVLDRGLGESVHPEHRRDGGQQVDVGADRVAGPQAGQAIDLRECPDHEQAREGVDQPQAGVDVLGVLEVHERLVQQHVDVRRQPGQHRPELVRAHVVAGRVVGVADDQHAGAAGDGVAQPAVLGDHGPRARVRGQQRVERVRGPGHDQLVASAQQRQRRRLQQLGGAVAERDALGRDAVAIGEQPAHRRRVAVRVAVDQAACARDRRVDDLGVRQVGPLGARQVEVGQALQRQPLLLLPARAALAVQLALVQVVELAVVVAEADATLSCAARTSAPAPG